MKAFSILILLLSVCGASCTPNRSIALDKTNDPNDATADRTPELRPDPPAKMTLAELMDKIVNAKPDEFLFPCDLNAYSAEDKESLRRLRDKWLRNEENDRFLISPSTGCVCPHICVLIVEDIKAPTSKKAAVLVVDSLQNNKYVWLARNLDLSDTKLVWASSTPDLEFYKSDGSRNYGCFIEFSEKKHTFVSSCGDGKKVFPPLESR